MQVRNLNYLNRDLEKVLLITANADAYELHPDNAVKVCPTHTLIATRQCKALLTPSLGVAVLWLAT